MIMLSRTLDYVVNLLDKAHENLVILLIIFIALDTQFRKLLTLVWQANGKWQAFRTIT